MKKYFFIIILIVESLKAFSFGYWEKVYLPAPYNTNYWLDIYFHPDNPNYGWACGFNGMVVRTTDGGATWLGSIIRGAYHLESIHFPTLQIGYTSGVEGIFKTINGGGYWFDITPDPLVSYWGCYFLNADTGWVVGGGCADTLQRFYKTTNGGTTWTLFTANEPNSGMTDLIVYPDGTGYAVSSGVLWKTTDMGNSWFVHSYTGTKVWQEEIAHLGNSFLLPTAGNTCAGSGNYGGMRFSTNDGQSWNHKIVRDAMFGSFLITQASGWACGYDRQVYFTSNAGISWVEYNCGIDEGNLDDIWFISSSNGWVVGQGIYRLSPPSARAYPQSITFGNVCIGNFPLDTVWIRNLSFYENVAQIYLLGPNASDYEIIHPNATEQLLAPCDSFPIIIRYKSNSVGSKIASLIVLLNGKTLNIQLTAQSVQSTLEADKYEVILNPVQCGISSYVSFYWTSSTSDAIVQIRRISGSIFIENATPLPVSINQTPTETRFVIVPQDTGWISASFEIKTLPCDNTKVITIRAYALSPIILAPQEVRKTITCPVEEMLEIPISNTGNADLTIFEIKFANLAPQFQILGLKSWQSLPAIIGIGNQDTLLVKFTPQTALHNTARIEIYNNDGTKIRGNKNPYLVDLTIHIQSPLLEPEIIDINLDTVCLNKTITKEIQIKNVGNLSAFLTEIKYIGHNLELSSPAIQITSISNDNLLINVKTLKSGYLRDTIVIPYDPCNKNLILIISGFAISSEYDISPKSFKLSAKVGEKAYSTLSIRSLSNINQKIKSITIEPSDLPITINFDEHLPKIIQPDKNVSFGFSISSSEEGTYNLNLCIEYSDECPQVKCLPIEFTSFMHLISYDQDTINFGVVKCNPEEVIQVLSLKNESALADTISSIILEQNGTPFSFIFLPALPIILAPGQIFDIKIRFLPSTEGIYTNKVIISTQGKIPQLIEVPISGEYRKIILKAERNFIDFGKVEACQNNIQDTLRIANNGLLADTLSIKNPTNPIIRVLSENKIFIESGGLVEIPIELDITQMQNDGYYTSSLQVESQTCKDLLEFTFVSRKITPKLVITPNIIDFGEVWVGDSIVKEVEIYNNSEERITYRIIGIEPPDVQFSFTPKNKTLEQFKRDSLQITFVARNVGRIKPKLLIEKLTNCIDTVYVELQANVPPERYYPYFIIDEYIAKPGDTVQIYVRLDTALKKLKPESIDLSISFDRFLLEPLKVEYLDKSQTLHYTFKNSTLNFSIVDAQDFFQTSGNKFAITALALLSKPTSTPINFEQININTSKQVNVLRKNGSFTLSDLCQPRTFTLLQTIPYVKSMKTQNKGNLLDIVLEHSGEQTSYFTLYSVYGQELSRKSVTLQNGLQVLTFELTDLPSGVYLFSFVTEYNQIFKDKIFLVK